MSGAVPPAAINHRRTRRAALRCMATLLAGGAVCAFAQNASAPVPPVPSLYLSGGDRSLWIAEVQGTRSTLFHRAPQTQFRRVHALNGRVTLATPVEDDLLVVLDDGAIFRHSPDPGSSPSREIDLPQRHRPLHLLAVGREIYGLVPSAAAAGMSTTTQTASAASAERFEPGDAPLSIVRYDGRRWVAVAPCPPVVQRSDGPLGPRLHHAVGELLLFWAHADQVFFLRLDPQTRVWRSGGTLGAPGLRGFWPTTVSEVPTLIVAGEDGRVLAYRLLGDSYARGEWTPAALEFGSPPGEGPSRAVAAAGFNQHVVVLAERGGHHILTYGAFGAPPLEAPRDLREILAPQSDRLAIEAPLQMLVFLAVLSVFSALLLLRRGSMTQLVPLPPGYALALTTQRAAAWLIDLLPFTLAASAAVGVVWTDAVRHMFIWAVSAQPGGDISADERLRFMLWWVLSAGGYAVYCLAMELTAGRTVGKLLLGIHVLSTTGAAPTRTQVLIRNASRVLELLPPIWVLGFLALLTRNRQRVGDIFARTIAVRRTRAAAAASNDNEPDGRDG